LNYQTFWFEINWSQKSFDKRRPTIHQHLKWITCDFGVTTQYENSGPLGYATVLLFTWFSDVSKERASFIVKES
jgi:hypothetical protein